MRLSRRLCMVVHGPYPVGEPRVEREALAARQAGWEVEVIAMSREGESLHEIVDGIRVLRAPFSHRRGSGAVATVAEYARFAMFASMRLGRGRRYDVVHVHAPPDFLVFSAILPRLRGTRVVLDIHDLSSDMFAMRFGSRRGARVADSLLRSTERAATRFASTVITVHEPYRRALIRRGVPAELVTVIMNTVDEARLPSPVPPEPDVFRIVYHGTITPSYGVDLLVQAAAVAARQQPRLRLELYGEGDALPAVLKLGESLGLGSRLVADGRYRSHAEVLRSIAGASAGVVPNRPIALNQFALSSKLFEYVALGIPAVVADLPTLKEHFSDDEVRFFPAGATDGLAAALTDVVGNPAAAARRAEHARRRYEKYRWPTQARRYLALLEELVAA